MRVGFKTLAAIGTAETPAEPISGLMGVEDNLFINFAINIPHAVPIANATIPNNKIPNVFESRNLSALSFEPTDKPKNIVVMLISAF